VRTASGDQFLQLRVLGLGLLQDRNAGIGVFPAREKLSRLLTHFSKPSIRLVRSRLAVLGFTWAAASLCVRREEFRPFESGQER
jgi:hypothetical protein